MTDRLAGRRAIAVGCAQGFGAQTARRLAEAGARVVVADIDGVKAEQTAAEITAAGGAATGMQVDIGHDASVRELVDSAASWLGGVDVLFNNAAAVGVPETFDDSVKPVMDIPIDVWDTVMRVNLRGPWLTSRYAIAHMAAGGGGSIINTGSAAASAIMPKSGAYSVSKGAVETLSKVIATQYGRQGIRCNTIHPGYIPGRHVPPDYALTVMAPHLLTNRLGVADDIAMLVVYLASDESGYITAQAFTVDGGLMSHGPTWAQMSSPDAPNNRVAPDGSIVG
jgi:NAD(P)-dependent dehydrogenase (short-subunit alcohol dehydrogenase family)